MLLLPTTLRSASSSEPDKLLQVLAISSWIVGKFRLVLNSVADRQNGTTCLAGLEQEHSSLSVEVPAIALSPRYLRHTVSCVQ